MWCRVACGWRGPEWAPGIFVVAGCIVACLVGACGGEEGEGPNDAGIVPSRDAAITPEVDDTPLGKSAASLRRFSKGEAWREQLESILSGWRGQRQPMTDLIHETYRKRGYRPVFIEGLWPNEGAGAMVKAVREIPSHGLPHSPYRPKVVVPLYSALAIDPEAGSGTLTAPIGDLDRLAELEWQMPRSIYKRPRKSERVPEVRYRPLKNLPEIDELETGVRCLLKLVHDSAESGRRVDQDAASGCLADGITATVSASKVQNAIEERMQHIASLALLDALLVQAFYQWMIDFTIDHRVHPFRSLGPRNRSRLPTKAQARLLKTLTDTHDGEAFSELLRGRVPQIPEYDQTRAALVRYVRLMDHDEIDELRATERLEKGSSGKAVKALQRRLAAEEYYDGPVNGEFDDETHDAVVRFQKNRQLVAGGVVGDDTVEILNIPFEWRVKQLITALARWRESPIVRGGEPDLYVRVNLPAFELEVIEGGKTTRRHKVIVGSNRRVKDPLNNDVVWHQRRTKIFDTKLNEVVLNPNWIVPELIRVDEISVKAQEDPNFLEENNFKQVGELLVQGPGPTNPLGTVKFSLESTDSIYLHDTDKRWLFSEVVRDFSHGCIRVDEPAKLAGFILAKQGVASERITKRISEGTTLPIEVESPIPTFVEYLTVGFSKSGDTLFYRDLYSYDVAYWKKRTPITRKFP